MHIYMYEHCIDSEYYSYNWRLEQLKLDIFITYKFYSWDQWTKYTFTNISHNKKLKCSALYHRTISELTYLKPNVLHVLTNRWIICHLTSMMAHELTVHWVHRFNAWSMTDHTMAVILFNSDKIILYPLRCAIIGPVQFSSLKFVRHTNVPDDWSVCRET